MKKFKLNFYRFADYEENINVGITMDTSTLPSSAQKVNSVMNDVSSSIMKVIEANDKLATSSNSAKTGLKKIAEDNIRRANASMGALKEQMASPFASANFKTRATSELAKMKMAGLDNVKIKDAGELSTSQNNKLLSFSNKAGNMISREQIAQTKEWKKANEEAIATLEKAYPVTDRVRAALVKLGLEEDKTANKSETFGQKLSKAFDKLKHYAVSWRIVYGVFQSIWNTLSETFEKAAAYQEALNLYTVAMGEYAEAGSKWADRISGALHLDPKQIMQYTGAFYNLVQGLGVGSDAAYVMSTNLTQLAYDMSSYLNIDVESAHAKIQSAITGQARAVASAGVAMQQASLQELAYTLGIKKSVSEMTQAEKTYLRYIQIMRSTTNMQTDLARTIITPENAIRVIKQQFELLGRAIGNVFIPIVMKAIPYVMALTQVLTELANKLASMLGFKLADINYNYLNLREVDTAVEDTMDNISGSAARGAKSVQNSINRTLAAFDELNVVESESSGGGYPGSGGLGGTGDNILGDLEDYITGYDMLQGLTDELDKQTENARKNLEKLGGVLKAVGAALLVIEGIKIANKMAKWAQEAKKMYNEGTGLWGILKKITSTHGELISTLGKVVGVFGTTIGAFTAGLHILDDWDGTLGNLLGKITLTTIEITALTGAAYALAGVAGATVTAVGALIGVFAGVSIGIEEYQRKLGEAARSEYLFDGVGVSLKKVGDSFDEIGAKITEYTDTIDTLSQGINNTTTNFERCYDSVQELHDAIVNGDYDDSDTIISKLKVASSELQEAIERDKQSHIDYHNTLLDNLKQEGIITESTYKQMKADGEQYYTWLALSRSDYAKELEVLDAKLAAGKITQHEYNEELQELNNKYLGIIEPINDAAGSLDNLFYIAGSKIDLENPEELYDLITRMKNTYDTSTTSLETQRKVLKDRYLEEKQGIELLLAPLQKKIDNNIELDASEQETYNKQIKRLADLREQYDLNIKSIDKQSTELGATYKNYLGTIYAQISEAGKLADDDIKGSVDTIKSELSTLNDFDYKESVTNLFDGLKSEYLTQGKTFSEGTISQFKKWGFGFGEAEEKGLQSAIETYRSETEDFMRSKNKLYKNDLTGFFSDVGTDSGEAQINSYNSSIDTGKYSTYETNKDLGKYSITGYTDGLWEEAPGAKKAIEDILDENKKAAEDKLEIHSPSKVFYRIGQNVIQGLIDGMNDGKGALNENIQNVIGGVESKFNLGTIPINFNVNANKSFNTLLQGLEKFSSKWGNGINDIIRNTGSVFNSLKLGGLSSLVFNAFKRINIKFFENGGYPTSGDLFFANENGNAEYIASLGNRTAVANQDQMIRAITDAILVGMQSIETNRGITQVYIGNEKVYEGQGTYQSRQADRYGTTYVKI